MEEEREVQAFGGLLDHIKEGDIVEARVKKTSPDYGVIHGSRGTRRPDARNRTLSYGKWGTLPTCCKVGELYKVRVIRFDREARPHLWVSSRRNRNRGSTSTRSTSRGCTFTKGHEHH